MTSKSFKGAFWGLSSPDEEQRLRSANTVVAHLVSGKATPEELDNTVNRFIKDLGSQQAPMRNGAALALTELLKGLPESDLRSELVLETCNKKHFVIPTRPSEEQKRGVVAKLLAAGAVTRSGRLASLLAGNVAYKIISDIVVLAARWSFVREACCEIVLRIIEQVPPTVARKFALPLTPAVNALDTSKVPPESLAACLALEKSGALKMEETAPDRWTAGGMVLPANIPRITGALEQAARRHRPEECAIHVAWVLTLEAVMNLEKPLRAESLKAIWTIAEQCRVPLMLLKPALAKIYPSELPIILSGATIRILTTFSTKQVGKQALQVILNACQERPELTLSMIQQLTGNGTRAFDIAVHSPVVSQLCSGLDHEAVAEILPRLFKMFANAMHATDEVKKEEEEEEETEVEVDAEKAKAYKVKRNRKWCLDLIVATATAPKAVQKSPEMCMLAAKFLCYHSYFIAPPTTTGLTKEEHAVFTGVEMTPPVSTKTRQDCNEQLSSLFGKLLGISFEDKTVASEEETSKAKEDSKVAKIYERGLMPSTGKLWAQELLSWLNTVLNAAGAQLAFPVPDSDKECVTATLKQAVKLEKIMAKEGEVLAKGRIAMIRMLLVHVALLVLLPTESQSEEKGNEDVRGILSDLVQACDVLPTPDVTKEEHVRGMDILVDIILAVISRPARVLRIVAEGCFRVFAPFVGQGGLTAITESLVSDQVLATDKGAQMDEDDDEEVDDDDDDSDDDEDDDEDEEEEEQEEGGGGEEEEPLPDEEEVSDYDMDDHPEELKMIEDNFARLRQEQTQKKQMEAQKVAFHLKATELINIFMKAQENGSRLFALVTPLFKALSVAEGLPNKQLFNRLRKVFDTLMHSKVKQIDPTGLKGVRSTLTQMVSYTSSKDKELLKFACDGVAFILKGVVLSQKEGVDILSVPDDEEMEEEESEEEESEDEKEEKKEEHKCCSDHDHKCECSEEKKKKEEKIVVKEEEPKLPKEINLTAVYNTRTHKNVRKLVTGRVGQTAADLILDNLHFLLARMLANKKAPPAILFKRIADKLPSVAWDFIPHIILQFPQIKRDFCQITAMELLNHILNRSKQSVVDAKEYNQMLCIVAPAMASMLKDLIQKMDDSKEKQLAAVMPSMCTAFTTIREQIGAQAKTSMNLDALLELVKSKQFKKQSITRVLWRAITGKLFTPSDQPGVVSKRVLKLQKRAEEFYKRKTAETEAMKAAGITPPPDKKQKLEEDAKPEVAKLGERGQVNRKASGKQKAKKKTELAQ